MKHFFKILYYTGMAGCLVFMLIPFYVWWNNPELTQMQIFKDGHWMFLLIGTVGATAIHYAYSEHEKYK
jgi:hypothetical protein